jgi:opacity protein-like surface antigen
MGNGSRSVTASRRLSARSPRFRTIAIFVLAWLLLPAGVLAQPDEPHPDDLVRPGWSVGLGFAYGLENFSHVGKADSAPGLDFRVGYRFNRLLGLDLDFQYYDGFKANALRVKNNSFGAWALSVNLKAGWPIGRFYPYGIGGIGAFDAELDQAERDFLARIGAGSDFLITRNIALTAEGTYNWPLEAQDSSNGLKDLEFASLVFGVRYLFD